MERVSTLTQPQHQHAPKKWNLAGLQGISDKTLELHFGLYEGYVKNTNLLNEQLDELTKNGQAAGANPHFAELTRRLGFERNGMRLHEYYFDNLTAEGGGTPSRGFSDAVGGDVEAWRKNFIAVGTMRGVTVHRKIAPFCSTIEMPSVSRMLRSKSSCRSEARNR